MQKCEQVKKNKNQQNDSHKAKQAETKLDTSALFGGNVSQKPKNVKGLQIVKKADKGNKS